MGCNSQFLCVCRSPNGLWCRSCVSEFAIRRRSHTVHLRALRLVVVVDDSLSTYTELLSREWLLPIWVQFLCSSRYACCLGERDDITEGLSSCSRRVARLTLGLRCISRTRERASTMPCIDLVPSVLELSDALELCFAARSAARSC